MIIIPCEDSFRRCELFPSHAGRQEARETPCLGGARRRHCRGPSRARLLTPSGTARARPLRRPEPRSRPGPNPEPRSHPIPAPAPSRRSRTPRGPPGGPPPQPGAGARSGRDPRRRRRGRSQPCAGTRKEMKMSLTWLVRVKPPPRAPRPRHREPGGREHLAKSSWAAGKGAV